jgi:predicted GIY-YIG superfamily endonuclease
MWYLYITKNRKGSFYTGITSNLEVRLKDHFQGKGGRYTKRNPPCRFLYSECFAIRAKAQAREQQIKRWSRAKKKALIEGSVDKLRKLSISRDHLVR